MKLPIGIALALLVLGAGPASAQSVEALYNEGVAARQEQRFDDAAAALRQAVALQPDNADALVQLGFAELGRNDLPAARQSFERALAIAPDYADASFGLAQVAFREGDVPTARAIIEPLAARNPDNAEFTALRQSVEQAALGETSEFTRFRLDLGTEISDLSGGRDDWTDSSVGLSYRLSPETTIAGRSRVATRGERTDVQLEARIDHAITPRLSAYGLLAVTPEADFLARTSYGAGGSFRAINRTGAFGPFFLDLDARYDEFSAADVWTVAPSIRFYVWEERLGLTARWIHAEDENGTTADGYLLRADVVATERLRLFAGYADAPEISEGTIEDTQTIFGGLAFDWSDSLTLNASYAHEQRDSFDRDTFGVGLSVRF